MRRLVHLFIDHHLECPHIFSVGRIYPSYVNVYRTVQLLLFKLHYIYDLIILSILALLRLQHGQ